MDTDNPCPNACRSGIIHALSGARFRCYSRLCPTAPGTSLQSLPGWRSD